MTSKMLARLLAGSFLLAILFVSPNIPNAAHAAPNAPIVVDDGGDAASCSGFITLRCAIVSANAAPFTNIRFASGITAVLLQSALPTITGNGTWIDGSDFGTRIDGSVAFSWTGDNGLTINASYVTISNMKIVNIPSGADISVIGGKDNEISYDLLGILPGATQCSGSQSTVGVDVVNDSAGSASSFNGTAYIYADTISCHGGSGIEVVNSNYVYVGVERDDSTPFGNNIGTTSDGTRAAGNGYAGVRIAVNSDQVVVRNNRIANNSTRGGVEVDGTNISVDYNTIYANYWGLVIGGGSTQVIVGNNIGTDGTRSLPNTHEGILISGGSGIFLSDNIVANNGGTGIAVTGNSTHALIQNNSIYRNGGLPIDLGNDGATPNGSQSLPGPNNWLPYPTATFSGSGVLGTACANCKVWIYIAIGNPAGPGGGGIFKTNVFADSSGNWHLNTLPVGLTRLDASFTASDPFGNASEMSPQLTYQFLPLIMLR